MSAALLTKRQAILPGSLQLSPKRRCKIRHFCLQISGICTCKKQVWNLKTQGKYSFKGSTTSQTLYTNYKFKGKTSYTFYVKNTGKYALTVKAKRLTKTYASTKISAGKSASVTFSDIKSTTEFYMTFEGSSFEGYIK